MSTISIHQALAQMSEAGDRPFRISFVRSTGKNAGSIKEALCYYGAPNPRDRQAPTQGEQGRKRKTHYESGTVPLTEVSSRQLLTPLISHIIYFHGNKVIH